MIANKKSKKSSLAIPSNQEDQHNFYAQFCFELSTIQEQSESEVTEGIQFHSHKDKLIEQLLQQKLEELIRRNEENFESNKSDVEFDDKTNLKVPIEDNPKFIDYISQTLKMY